MKAVNIWLDDTVDPKRSFYARQTGDWIWVKDTHTFNRVFIETTQSESTPLGIISFDHNLNQSSNGTELCQLTLLQLSQRIYEPNTTIRFADCFSIEGHSGYDEKRTVREMAELFMSQHKSQIAALTVECDPLDEADTYC